MFGKLRQLISRTLSGGTKTSGSKKRQSSRFVPSFETLECRSVPASFTVGGFVDFGPEPVVGESAKVSFQDFSFTKKMDKSSPMLMAAGDADSSKVSFQDFHFVQKMDKASPMLMAKSAEGVDGEVSIQGISFTQKVSKSSPKLMAADEADSAKVTFQDISIVKTMDKSSPMLMAKGAEGTQPSIEENVSKDKPKGDDHIKIVLSDVLVSSYQLSGASS